MQELIDSNKIQRNRIEGLCNNCGNNNLLQKTEIHSVGKIIILQLELFEKNNNQINKKPFHYNIKNVSKETLKIENKNYTCISAILHHGSSIAAGHYTSLIRKDKKSWYEAKNLNISKKNWSRNSKNVYLFILERL